MESAHPMGDARASNGRKCTSASRLLRRVVVVHNGIIENFLPMKRKLLGEDHTFVTETDTEVIAHLIEKYLK
jgi:glucosamine 6-phosphate synthetase-like amidotransferase/phosphosugar isomerase protein